MRTPFAIMLGVLIALLAGSVAGGEWSNGGGARAKATATAPVATIARRVQTLRGLRFTRIPKPVRVTPAQARKEGEAELERPQAARRLRAAGALYALLGLVPPRTDLARASAQIYGEQVAGYYDPRDGRLRIVDGAGTANRVTDEVTISHELTHALEDQAIGLREDDLDGSDDGGLAYQGLVEGAASSVMDDYLRRYFDPETGLGGILASAFSAGSTSELPPFVQASLIFPYLTGEAFVRDLRKRAGGRWTLVDLAERSRPPRSTEQLMHPRKWIEVEGPDRVRLPGLGRALDPVARRLTSGTFGEWQTRQLLATSGAQQPEAAAGWGGDRYELWRSGAGDCATPCVGRDVLVMRWRWDTPRDARRFARALPAALREGLRARRAGRGRWRSRGGALALSAATRTTTLVLAPAPALAERVMRASNRVAR